ncbi:retrovirus-related pol polyprotein from transposon TNT 1-94 [Tanacetum coccineum]
MTAMCGKTFRVVTLRAVIYAGDKTSGDARSWYMISGDAKSWVCFDKDGIILYLVQCESLCRIPVFPPLTGCDTIYMDSLSENQGRNTERTKFLNKILQTYFKEEGIEHQTSTDRTPEQNGVVERQNRTLVEAARTMLSASKLPFFFWAEAIATACYTQNRSLIIPRHEKTPYHIINDKKPTLKHLHIFGCTCYLVRDGENLDKMKEKGGPCIFVGYSTQSNGYRDYNKRTRLIIESIHINFDDLKDVMTSVHNSPGPAPQQQMTSDENTSGHGIQDLSN